MTATSRNDLLTPTPPCGRLAIAFAGRQYEYAASLRAEGVPLVEPAFLDHEPLWAFFLLTSAFALLTGECGYRCNRPRQGKVSKVEREGGGTIVGATFGLLAPLFADFDRPLEGFIRVNYQGMNDLQNSMNADNS